MQTEISLHLSDTDGEPEFRVVSLTRNRQYIEINKGSVCIHGTRRQIDAFLSCAANEHAKRLTDALRVLLDMPDSSDEEVQLAASLRINEKVAA